MKYGWVFASIFAVAGAAQAGDFKVESADFKDGVVKQAQYSGIMGCTGGNVSPVVTWSGAPKGTKSFVVTLYDKDAPTGSGFWHWVVVDIPATTRALDLGAGTDSSKLPNGARMTNNDAGQAAFMGACPPPGETHEYRITVKAVTLDRLPVPDNASGALVGFISNMNKLAEASVVANGSR